jgi:hypothetical protein
MSMICGRCNQEKMEDQYYILETLKDGTPKRRKVCIECKRKEGREGHYNKKNNIRHINKQIVDITGQKFNRLTALSWVEGYKWLWKCSCGTQKIIVKQSVLSGGTKSCGCLNKENIRAKEDIIGKKFNRWTVIAFGPDPEKGKRYRWLCRCECGKESLKDSTSLKTGASKSCGCFSVDYTAIRNRKYPGNVARNNLVSNYRNGARDRGFCWELTHDQCETLFLQRCHYCGILPSRTTKSKHEAFTWNGIDRIDSKLGYTTENTVTCCYNCNYAKRDMSKADFLAWINRISNHQYGE